MIASSVFEIVGPSRARIGGSELKVFLHEDNPDERYVIEATADQRQEFSQYYPPHELRKVRPIDLPNGIYIAIERLERGRSTFRNLHFLTIQKRSDQLTLNLIIYFEHWDWHLPESVSTFAERYAAALTAASPSSTGATSRIQDAGVEVNFRLVAQPDRDIYSTFLDAADLCLQQFRACVAQGYKVATLTESGEQSKTAVKTEGADSSGLRWWVRYVLVPVIGSGTFAAVVAALFALSK